MSNSENMRFIIRTMLNTFPKYRPDLKKSDGYGEETKRTQLKQ